MLTDKLYRARSAVRHAAARMVAPLDVVTLRRLFAVSPPLVEAITAKYDQAHPTFRQIEEHRASMLRSSRPLVDPTLGSPGIYDRNQSVGDACAVSKRPRAAYLLYRLAREFAPTCTIELGTNVGISSAYIAAGLGGRNFTTLEASAHRIALAKALHSALGLHAIRYVEGLFQETLSRTLNELPAIEMAFIDGHHQYQPTLDYFDLIWRHSADNCLVIFDDIRWSEGMKCAWHNLQNDTRIAVAVDLSSVGVCIATRQPSVAPYRTRVMSSVLA